MIWRIARSSGDSLKSGPSRQTMPPSRPTMASTLASRLLMMTLFGGNAGVEFRQDEGDRTEVVNAHLF
jgi:hypothetical protein